MEKPVSAPAVAAASCTPAAAARGKSDLGDAEDPRPAPNGSGRGVKDGSASTKATSKAKAEGNAHSEAHSSDDASVDFGEVFAELLRYRGENGGSLAIPASHPTLARLIDIQFDLGMEGLAKRRWDDGLAALKKFGKDNGGNCAGVPPHHRGLGSWAAIQRRHYDQYARGMKSALTRKRFAKLTATGFGGNDAGDGVKAKVDGHNRGKPDMQNDVENGTKKKAMKTEDEDTDCDEDAQPQKGNRKRATKTNAEHAVKLENTKGAPYKAVDYGIQKRGKAAMQNAKNDTEKRPLKTEEEETDREEDEDRANPERGGGGAPFNAAENDGGGKSEPSPSRIKKERRLFEAETLEAKVSRCPGVGAKQPKIEGPGQTQPRSPQVATHPGRCDVCEKKDRWWGDNLQKCRDCGLLVHEQCYGMRETDTKDPDFICYACKSVGTNVEVNVPSKLGGCGNRMGQKRELIRQEKRPTECVLCSHDIGIHAMHPLLDTHGPEGRQLVIERKVLGDDGLARRERKLAWVHTLCANFICSNPKTAGCVYGCMKDGSYEGEEDSCEEEEYSSEENERTTDADANTSEKQGDEEDSIKVDEKCPEDVRYYAIATGEGYDKVINDHRSLKCFVCGVKDKMWKIPVQCPAGDSEENEMWKDRHPRGTMCFVAMHVGCARWGCVKPEGSHLETINGKKCRLCYFYPGRDAEDIEYEEKSKTVAHCYCKAHARDIIANNPKRKKNINEGSSISGKAKSSDRDGKSAQRSAKESVKKSLNSIRHREGNANFSIKGKKKSGTAETLPERAFGAPSPKGVKVGFVQENTVHYPVRGKSASAMAGISGQGVHKRLGLVKNDHRGGVSGVLSKRKNTVVSDTSSGKFQGKRRRTAISDPSLKAEPLIASPGLGAAPAHGDEKQGVGIKTKSDQMSENSLDLF